MKRTNSEQNSGLCVTTASALAALVAAVSATAIATASAVAVISGAGTGSSLASAIFIAAVLAAAASGLLAACIAGSPIPSAAPSPTLSLPPPPCDTNVEHTIVLPLATVQDGLKTLVQITKSVRPARLRRRAPSRRHTDIPHPPPPPPPPPKLASSPTPSMVFHERCGRILRTCDLLVRHFPAKRTLCILRTAESIIARRPHRTADPEPQWESDIDVDLDPVLSAPNLDEALRRLDQSIRSAKKYKELNDRLQSTSLVLEAEKRRTIRSSEQQLEDTRPEMPSSSREEIHIEAEFIPKPKARSSLLQPNPSTYTEPPFHLSTIESIKSNLEEANYSQCRTQFETHGLTCSQNDFSASSFVEMNKIVTVTETVTSTPQESVAVSSSSFGKETENVANFCTKETASAPEDFLTAVLSEDVAPVLILPESEVVSSPGIPTEDVAVSSSFPEAVSSNEDVVISGIEVALTSVPTEYEAVSSMLPEAEAVSPNDVALSPAETGTSSYTTEELLAVPSSCLKTTTEFVAVPTTLVETVSLQSSENETESMSSPSDSILTEADALRFVELGSEKIADSVPLPETEAVVPSFIEEKAEDLNFPLNSDELGAENAILPLQELVKEDAVSISVNAENAAEKTDFAEKETAISVEIMTEDIYPDVQIDKDDFGSIVESKIETSQELAITISEAGASNDEIDVSEKLHHTETDNLIDLPEEAVFQSKSPDETLLSQNEESPLYQFEDKLKSKFSLDLDLTEVVPSKIDKEFEQLLENISPPNDDIDISFSAVSSDIPEDTFITSVPDITNLIDDQSGIHTLADCESKAEECSEDNGLSSQAAETPMERTASSIIDSEIQEISADDKPRLPDLDISNVLQEGSDLNSDQKAQNYLPPENSNNIPQSQDHLVLTEIPSSKTEDLVDRKSSEVNMEENLDYKLNAEISEVDTSNKTETNLDLEIQSFIKDNLGAEAISDCASDSSSISVSPNPDISFFRAETNSKARSSGEDIEGVVGTNEKGDSSIDDYSLRQDVKTKDSCCFGDPLVIVKARKVTTYFDETDQQQPVRLIQKQFEEKAREIPEVKKRTTFREDFDTSAEENSPVQCTTTSHRYVSICKPETSICNRLKPEALLPFSSEPTSEPSRTDRVSPSSDALPSHFFRSLERRDERRPSTFDHSSSFPLSMRVPHRRAFWDTKVTETESPKSESPKRHPSIKVPGIVQKCKETFQTLSSSSEASGTAEEDELTQGVHRRRFQQAKHFFQSLEGKSKEPMSHGAWLTPPLEVPVAERQAIPKVLVDPREKRRHQPATVEERFNVTGIYRDVLGDGAAKTAAGSALRGVPRRKAVVATLDSFPK